MYYKAFQPRVGFAYSPDTKTVVRGGYGSFTRRRLPGWGGVDTTGFTSTVSFSSTLGLQPAFILSQDFRADFQHPPMIPHIARAGFNLRAFDGRGPMRSNGT